MTMTLVPAIACPLSGTYLIEASAGTGKTWTLTGILLRLLIEKGVAPEKIVATTFTNAAAQEMQERLHGRLVDFYAVCQWAKRHQAVLYQLDLNDEMAFEKICEDGDEVVLSALSDPINRHLLLGVLQGSPARLDKVLHKSQLLLATLDKMFVGTLDSLAQKWLTEFAFELGESRERELLTDTSELVGQFVHDELRAIHAYVYHHSPRLYACLDPKVLTDVPAMVARIDNALQFFTAPIDEPAKVSDDELTVLQDWLDELLAWGVDEFLVYFDETYRHQSGMNKNTAIAKHFGRLPAVMMALQKQGLPALMTLDNDQTSLLLAFGQDKLNNPFKKGEDKALMAWQALPLERLARLGKIYQAYSLIQERFVVWLTYHVVTSIKEKLVKFLKENNKTSFTLTMVSLVQGLSGNKGELIARHIRHLYPVALIDEAQDISGEQAALIERVYLSQTAKRSLFEQSDKGFLLLVGDPKQAIYRFRGGDVANYNYMKSLGLNTDFTLSVNRRSNQSLIAALNAWFGADGESSFGEFGEGIAYQTITAANDVHRLVWHNQHGAADELVGTTALTLLRLPKKNELSLLQATALHINTLLQSGFCVMDDGKERVIVPSDIAVLLPTNQKAQEMQEILAALGIEGVTESGRKLFAGRACVALQAFLSAILMPEEGRLGTLLLTLFGFELPKAWDLLRDDAWQAKLRLFLKQAYKHWQSLGLMSMLSWAFARSPFDDESLWVRLSRLEDSAYLGDMWQLFDVVSSWQLPPALLLDELAYQQQQNATTLGLSTPSDAGVSLMTMHKSKGLEFTIVYVIGLDGGIAKAKPKLYPYIKNHQRRLSPSRAMGDDEQFFETLDKAEELNEKKRVGYVALTRASEQLFVVGQEGKKSQNPMQAWGLVGDDGYQLPSRLKDKVDVRCLGELISRGRLTDRPYRHKHAKNTPIAYPDWEQCYQKTAFDYERVMSFTALTRLFDVADRAGVGVADDGGHEQDGQIATTDIRAGFVRGARAGVFLHSALEALSKKDATNSIAQAQEEQKTLQKMAEQAGITLDEPMLMAVHGWLWQVLSLPFLASGVALMNIPITDRQHELEFLLSVGENFKLETLHELFAHHDKPLPAFAAETLVSVGYVQGVIDLVYTTGGRYYVVDYKSNFLGESIYHYHINAMTQAMDEHSYWLQAALYQLALHRMLSLQIADYQGNEESYLGAVEYVFIRGVDNHRPSLGRLTWHMPIAFIMALDQLFL